MGRVARLGPAHLHAPVPAHVQQHPDLAVVAPHHDERIVHDPPHHVVTGVRDLGHVGQELPAPAEEAVALEAGAISGSLYIPAGIFPRSTCSTSCSISIVPPTPASGTP